jgi:hypothetical protein
MSTCQTLLQENSNTTTTTKGVSHCDLAIYIKKYLDAKEELGKLKYIITQKYDFGKIL